MIAKLYITLRFLSYVKLGPDWKWLDQDGGKNNIGSVYRVNKNNTVHVIINFVAVYFSSNGDDITCMRILIW